MRTSDEAQDEANQTLQRLGSLITNQHYDSSQMPQTVEGAKFALKASWGHLKTGRREWDRTTDHHHVKVVLYH